MLAATHLPAWLLVLIPVYPALTVALLEIGRRTTVRAPLLSNILLQLSYVLLPSGAIWLILRWVAELPPDNMAVRGAETAFVITGLYLLLGIAQAGLMRLADERMSPPKLLVDILRIGLLMVCGSVVVSSIWRVDLGSLLAAMGVGSIVLGFALQEFLGNLLSGLGLLSAHKFGLGDWIMVENQAAQVVEMDWRTVTLVTAAGERMVIANSTLAKGNLIIAARAGQNVTFTVPLALGVDIPPERVRDAVIEAGQAAPNLSAPGAKCVVVDITHGLVKYDVILSVANPGSIVDPRDEFLSRFWYVAQRRGLHLDGTKSVDAKWPDAAARLRMLREGGAFRSDSGTMAQLAQASSFRRYRRGDTLLTAGSLASDAFLVEEGQLTVTISASDGEVRLELVAPGQLMVLQEMLAGGSSPVAVMARQDADVLAIPVAALIDAMNDSPEIARDIGALVEARRQAIMPLIRRPRPLSEANGVARTKRLSENPLPQPGQPANLHLLK